MVPEVTVREFAQRLAEPAPPLVLDVREAWEIEHARLPSAFELAPMSHLAERGPASLPASAQDKACEIFVLCHHGIRSAQVAHWLLQQGWTNVKNIRGGIDAYAREVDASVGLY